MNQQASTRDKDWKKRIILFLTSQTVSLLGSSLTQYAIIWYVTLTTSSGLMLTISTLVTFIPQVLISLFAGVWADRYNRKHLIICADALVALSTLGLAFSFFVGYRELWIIFLVSAIRSVGTGIQTPTVNALIPQITPKSMLMRVTGFNGSLQNMTMIVAPAVSGALLPQCLWNRPFSLMLSLPSLAFPCCPFSKSHPTNGLSLPRTRVLFPI